MMNSTEEKLKLEKQWNELRGKLKEQFGKAPDLNALLMLIGIRELGAIKTKFTKEEKQDLMHIATCRLLSSSGYYKLNGLDPEGWPHWELVRKLPVMNIEEQEDLIKEHIIEYFLEMDY